MSPWIVFDAENCAIAECLLQTAEKRGLRGRVGSVLGPVAQRALLTRPPCRFEEVRSPLAPEVRVVLDVAHNEAGITALMSKLRQENGGYSAAVHCRGAEPTSGMCKFRFVVGFSEEKDIRSCLQIILAEAPRERVHFAIHVTNPVM